MEASDKKKLLKQRAEKLSQKQMDKAALSGVLSVVIFSLAGERYAFESLFIKEIYALKNVTPLPGVPSFVYGLINIRRRIVSVIDLRPLFSLPVKVASGLAKIIVLNKGDMEFGVLAEEILGLGEIDVMTLQERLPSLIGIHQEFFKGITSDRLLVLGAEKLLNSPSIRVNQANGK